MWRFTTLIALMLIGFQAIASEQRKPRVVGTQAAASTEGLPKVIVERIKRIESKRRPRARAWSGEDAKSLKANPSFARARQIAVERGAKFHNRVASKLELNQKEKAQFLSILAKAHEARLDAMVDILEQGSDYPKRIQKIARTEKLPTVIKKSDPRITRSKLLRLLGKERFAAYLHARDRVTGSLRKGGAK